MTSQTRNDESSGDAVRIGDAERPRRVLVVADEVFRGSELAEELATHVKGEELVQIHVIAPAMARNALNQELGNIDETLGQTEERLGSVIAELKSAGLEASGEVGDLDPLVAVGDGIRTYDPDEIIVVLHQEDDPDQGEKGLGERLRTEFHQPVTQLKVGHPASAGDLPEVEEIEHVPAHERTEEEVVKETRNFPHLEPRDIAGIIFGVVGTIALGMIALAVSQGQGTNGQDFGGKSAIVILIAIGAFLINVAHVVGLVFFQSVRYTGVFERFMARSSIIVTSVGLVAALVLWLT